MTYTSLMVKMLVTTVFATSLIAMPQPVNTTELIGAGATMTIPTSTPPVAVVKKSVIRKSGDCSKYASLLEKYDWSTTTAMQICTDESHGYPETINWNDKHKDKNGDLICISSRGLMQIGCIHAGKLGSTLETLLDPEINVAVAYEIYKESGWCPWTTYKGPGCE